MNVAHTTTVHLFSDAKPNVRAVIHDDAILGRVEARLDDRGDSVLMITGELPTLTAFLRSMADVFEAAAEAAVATEVSTPAEGNGQEAESLPGGDDGAESPSPRTTTGQGPVAVQVYGEAARAGVSS